MKLDYVEVCGFRGFRDKVRVDFGGGFTVITGRNGVGKSTICDAVEFAITGLIEKYAVEKAAKESLADYLWWRGAGDPEAHYVTAVFVDDKGKTFKITRTREGGADVSPQEIKSALCRGLPPEDALRQLTRTSIIRDELIAALSLDLSETERFDLVRSALGAIEGAEAAVKARDVVTAADAEHSRNEVAYENARAKLGERLTQQSEAQAALSRSGDVSAALQIVDEVVPNTPADMVVRLKAARSALADGRTRVARSAEAVGVGRSLRNRQHAFREPKAVTVRQTAKAELEKAREAKNVAVAAVIAAESLLAREEEVDAVAASLAILVEHGERLGVHEDHCPLCAAHRTSAEFVAGIEAARRRISSLASGVQAARQSMATVNEAAREASMNFSLIEREVTAHQAEERALRESEETHAAFFERWKIDPSFLADPDGLEAHVAREHDRLINLERALIVLEASQAVSGMASIEKAIEGLRQDIDTLADVVNHSQNAASNARKIERAVKRVSAEIIDERLAQISPLLNQLYQRLRPHADWRTIDYSIRGDVKRFLSLKVGEGLNPQFVFSSGQRRAAGLAFLLSVHLSRAWTPWRTLLLDDPVQHIDDFRALHLVEVLAALRHDRHQIICAVEDPALADLLCRRLISTSAEPGRRYDIDLGPEGATSVLTYRDIPPMPVRVLRSEFQVVGE
ncbi:AAA family ATPase [Brucella rhizosphaerae]|uniref:AAA family ATPase n=1 Tax=Brucella rhizosphaerae TaxID=571254 RepID=UPI000466C7E2|nr:AAA family ATPase [Brucella rhizosphaerae]